jgi:hypothetical protein
VKCELQNSAREAGAFIYRPDDIGFHVVDFIPKGNKFNTHRYISTILRFFADWNVDEIRAIDRKLIMHADHVRLHMAKVSLAFIEQNGMKRASHLPYSPDLTLSDFFLFDHIKGFLVITLSNQPMTFVRDSSHLDVHRNNRFVGHFTEWMR